ncbi:E3 ubiquitin-protein ligase FANCL-like [Mya arenaria]|uniref:E3 ubiquitin-protein ligase FANCL-like n=1 Tax=Mya arenaria TaxID=6604 RepID=UPI0022E36D53|nr:E3 ubiquitin-protein ligase FANCL-like [Mya arenaria]XP_052767648.1 E3 ubiquitin-protein ligase FANCL-like [Mya arenaria]XP_052767649.1 E3 ubiquitin-protein ligase FANCL-like [Mya arenaria]
MNILTDFPYLIPQEPDGFHYNGYISIKNKLFRLEVKLPSSGNLQDGQVNCDWKLRQVLGNFSSILKQRLQQCDTLHSFLKELQSVAERQLEKETGFEESSSQLCRQLITDIEDLGWEKLAYVDDDFQEIHLAYTDSDGRTHVLKLYINKQYPHEAPKYSVQLPVKFELHWSGARGLTPSYQHFVCAVQSYQEFWSLVGELDSNTWVLEPEKPAFSARHRRIAIDSSVSVQITVDPVNPRALPDCKFLGSDHAIAPLRQSMNNNISDWDENGSLLKNLEHLLDVKFPSPSTHSKEEFSAECGICYAYRLEDEIPDEVCNDARCHQPFHRACLVEWLRALPSSRQSFNTIFGSCPYCEKAMTVKLIAR